MTATLTPVPETADTVDVDAVGTEAPTRVLTDDELERLGAQLDAVRDEVLADLGQRDADHIRGVVRLQRGLEVSGRVLLMAGILPPAWLGGVAALSLAKILDNMEIGHNVMHGQYDWMQDPALDSATFEWDTACPADQWRHSHNYVHHTFTNVLGQDRDVGYGLLRMTDEQRWHPRDLGNPVYALALAALFQWGVALHDVELDRVVAGTKTPAEAREKVEGVWRKARTQVLKDYALYPALAGPAAPVVLSGNLTANLVRNLWTFAVIFCGHFPDGVETFTPEEAEGEGRGGWYRRQLLGSANFRGGPLLHLLTGNLSHQIEHHMFPDLPAHRYAEIAEQVRAVCAEHGLPYNTGTFPGQLGTVARRIASLALPGREDEPVASRLGQLVGRLNPLGR